MMCDMILGDLVGKLLSLACKHPSSILTREFRSPVKGEAQLLVLGIRPCLDKSRYCCGDYCDDITAILVQWNVKEKTDNVSDS